MNAQLATLLSELGWRPETLARKLSEYAQLHGRRERVHPKTPYKWLAGALPRAPWPDLAAALLTAELTRPVTPADLGWNTAPTGPPLPADSGLDGPWTSEGALRAIAAVTEADPMQRRLLLTLMGTAITAPAHQWLLASEVSDLTHTSGTRIGIDTVDEIDTMTASLRRMDDQLGGGTLLKMVRAHLRHVLHLLRHGSYDDTTGRRLHASAAELLRLAGWLCFDTSQHARAQRYWIAALRTAHTAGDRALAANVLGFMSCQAKDIGQPREAALLADTAISGYPGASARVSAILQLRAAEAHAVAGSALDTRRAIDTAFIHLDATSTSAPDWSYWLDETHAHGQAGYCYLRLGEYAAARRHLRAALRVGDGNDSREGALRYTLLATTYARQPEPDLDHTMHLAGHAVDLLTDQITSTRVAGHLTTLLTDLRPYRRQPAVRELSDRVHALHTTTNTRTG
ncbi:hypothetical protein [Nocardia cyriacigeorgica]|uniref:hypothetical protein n=1 Tax=Nocardia cyriacigeorgica TaxID=135487 RepID=UPI001894A35B|nr:hypothetical protein [Nocardia cyriacigeorgica]MBF6289985.1 hypothetical protein [Nocardia cyriacigeorgica]